ncbi:hypothetical protein MRB53_042332 [Persea americana]|nr:hypothetical protein MRB53_042332 [Persea americana]
MAALSNIQKAQRFSPSTDSSALRVGRPAGQCPILGVGQSSLNNSDSFVIDIKLYRTHLAMLVSLTVGKVDAGVAVLLTEDRRLIEFPSILLPPDIHSGSIVDINVARNQAAENTAEQKFASLQDQILSTFGKASPSPPVLRCRNATQTSVVLEWDPIQLATAELRSLSLYRNGTKAGVIPKDKQSTKISGLALDTEYTFHLVLRTSAGQHTSEKITSQEVKHGKRAVEMNVPVVVPDWIKGCEREGRLVGVRSYYLDADPKHRQLGDSTIQQQRSGSISTTAPATSSNDGPRIEHTPPTPETPQWKDPEEEKDEDTSVVGTTLAERPAHKDDEDDDDASDDTERGADPGKEVELTTKDDETGDDDGKFDEVSL